MHFESSLPLFVLGVQDVGEILEIVLVGCPDSDWPRFGLADLPLVLLFVFFLAIFLPVFSSPAPTLPPGRVGPSHIFSMRIGAVHQVRLNEQACELNAVHKHPVRQEQQAWLVSS